MKRKLLAICAFALSIAANAQVLLQDNFESYATGNTAAITTSLADPTFGFGQTWISYCSTGGILTDFSVIQNLGNKYMNIKSGTSGSATQAGRYLIGIPSTSWEDRTIGNDIIELSYSFFTGPESTQATISQIYLESSTAEGTIYPILAGFHFNNATKNLSPLLYFYSQSAGQNNNYSIGLGTSVNQVMSANTWINVKCTYNKLNGEASFLFPGLATPIIIQNASIGKDYDNTAYIGNFTPATGITSKQDLLVDNFSIKAIGSLSTEDHQIAETGDVKVFPNPANDIINISSTLGTIEHYAIVDLTGKTVKYGQVSNLENLSVNIQELASGAYIMNIKTDKAIKNLKFVKK